MPSAPPTDLPAIQAQAKAPLEAEIERLKKRQEFTEEWYAVRVRRIEDTAKREGIWPEIACILANGTAGAEKEPYEYEPPTYAQQLNVAKHHAEKAEKDRDQAKAEAQHEKRAADNWAAKCREAKAQALAELRLEGLKLPAKVSTLRYAARSISLQFPGFAESLNETADELEALSTFDQGNSDG